MLVIGVLYKPVLLLSAWGAPVAAKVAVQMASTIIKVANVILQLPIAAFQT